MDINECASLEQRIHIEPTQAGTKEWLEASKHMIILAYVDSMVPVELAGTPENEKGEPAFGSHIREAIDILRSKRT